MSAGHTEAPWQTKHDYSLEGLATIIANVDGEIIEGGNHYTYDTVAICADEFGEYLPNAASNARLIVAACNSYDRQCGERAIEAAEGDLLGRCLEALRRVSAIRPANWDDGDDDEMIASFNAVDDVLRMAGGAA